VIARRFSRWAAALAVAAIVGSPVPAQYVSSTTQVEPNNYPPALPARKGPAPSFVFERVGEVALPGPLGSAPGWIENGLVAVPVDGGIARVAAEPDAQPSVGAGGEAPAVEWVVASSGKRRYRTTAEGLVEAEHRRSTKKDRWSRSWRIIAPNSILSPPVLVGPRLCYAGLDDRVTCVRASNGHRLWAVDLGDRLSRALACWPSCGDNAGDDAIILAVPDDGASVIALDAYDGRKIATYDLPAHHRFASPALVVSHDRIAIARKGYEDREAALVVLRLAPAPAGAAPAAAPTPGAPTAVPYNGGSPARPDPPGR
jgi:hypothetical protein